MELSETKGPIAEKVEQRAAEERKRPRKDIMQASGMNERRILKPGTKTADSMDTRN